MILEQAGHYIDEARRLIRMELYKIEKHLMGELEYKPISRSLRDGRFYNYRRGRGFVLKFPKTRRVTIEDMPPGWVKVKI